jgi:hypothetical protein
VLREKYVSYLSDLEVGVLTLSGKIRSEKRGLDSFDWEAIRDATVS